MAEQFVHPSREDAWDMTRREKSSLIFLMNATSAWVEAKDDLAERLTHIDGGPELMQTLVDGLIKLLTEIRMTIPVRQRTSLANTAKDYEMRMVPKMTPSKTNVVVEKEDFRELVNAAQVKCTECAELNENKKTCELFRLLQVVLPLDAYDTTFLCPYNRAEWEN